MDFSLILGRFADVDEHDDGGYLAKCPAHDDSRPSLRIWRGDDNKVRITCRAGCKPDDVIAAVGLTWPNLFDVSGEGNTVRKERPTLVGAGPVAGLRMFLDGLTLYPSTIAYAAERFGLSEYGLRDLGIKSFDPAADSTTFPAVTRAFADFPRMVH